MKKRALRLKDVPGIGVDKMGNAADAAHDPEILRLENMDTDILPSPAALEATRNAIGLDEANSYLPFLGSNELRKAAALHVSRMSGMNYDWQRQCVITAGGMSGILNCFLSLLDPGDEVILTDPIYAGIINRIRIAGGITKFVPLIPSPEGWRLDVKALAQAATTRTRIVVIANPSMPTGHVLDHAEWAAIAELCSKTDAWLLYDAALERILYDGRHVTHPASLPGMYDRTITVGSASKELRMIGWRVGWVVGPEEVVNDVGLVDISNTVCQVGISMPGVAAALAHSDDDVKVAVKTWQARRDKLLQELQGLPFIPPHGGWSLLMDTTLLNITPSEAAERLLKEAKIAATPMTGWGERAAKYLRFVFANEPEERLEGMGNKVKKVLAR